jgi:hypothetical protein
LALVFTPRIIAGVHGFLKVLNDVIGAAFYILFVILILLLRFRTLENFTGAQGLGFEIFKKQVHLIENKNERTRREVFLVTNILQEGSRLDKTVSRIFITLIGVL